MKQTTADKMLASLRRGADATPDALKRLGVDPAVKAEPKPEPKVEAKPEPKPEPVKREVAETPKPKAEKPAKAKSKKSNAANVSRNVDFDVSTGKGIKHLTIRVPKEMAADLTLLAMRNKLSENGEPTTINELGIRAFTQMLEEAA
ncbi:MAG: hypothetical protein AAGD32_05795 [Planctomycetota bacterium]